MKPTLIPTSDRIGVRVNLTLPVELVEQIDRIATVTKGNRARLVRSWLVEAMPVWREVADALELAKRNEAEGLRKIQAVLKGTGDVAQQMSLDIKNTRRRLKRKNATS